MRTLQNKQLLREYIRELLTEDDGGAYGEMMDLAASSPMGMEFVGRDQLMNIFVGPFITAIGHTTGKVKEISASAISVLRIAFETIATTLIPILQSDYADIFSDEQKQLEKIRNEYGHYYQETFEALHNDDVLVAAFLYQPELFMTNSLAKRAPKAVAKTLSILSGGLLDKILGNFLNPDDEKKKTSSKKAFSKPSGDMGYGGMGGSDMWYEGLIREDSEEKEEESPLMKLINNGKVKKLIANSDQTKKLASIGHKVVDDALQKVEQRANTVMNVKSLEELQRNLGKKIPGLEKLSKVPQQERQVAEQQLLKSVKQSIKEFYIKQLTSQIKKAVSSGVPQDHPYVKAHEATLLKIKNM
jgi:hypothetical protein